MAIVTVQLISTFQVIPYGELRQAEIVKGNEVRWWLTGCGDGPFSMTFEGENADDEDASDAIANQFFEDLIDDDGAEAEWVKLSKEGPWCRNGIVVDGRTTP